MKTFEHYVAAQGERQQRGRALTGGYLRAVSLCGLSSSSLVCGGRTFVPDAATAYLECFLSHAFPVCLDQANPGERPDRTSIHPQTVANSYASLRNKVVNLAHIMRSYQPDKHVRDRILGTVVEVEFPAAPEGRWQVQGDPERAPGIRVIAALHKAAEGVPMILETWAEGRTPFSPTQWTVSMENESRLADGGFLVKCGVTGAASCGLIEASSETPEDFRALGWTYVPWLQAPPALRACLKAGDHLGVEQDYCGYETRFLNGGLDGQIFYYGLALTPVGKESAARVGRIEASASGPLGVAPASAAVCQAVGRWAHAVGERLKG